ncbi:MAG: hypothetical protein IPN86_03425 [Saprospiraceae bacterium]|nr:hypothetical protein [Saprospiraceae bacterium]
MEIIKYLSSKKVYLLINIIILLFGYGFINKGINLIDTNLTGSNIYVSIGTSLIAAGIIIFLDLWKMLTINKITEKVKNIINESGVERIFKKRDLDRYDDLIKNLNESLDICGYSLGGFFESFGEAIINKSQNNIKVRVLFVDPESEAARQRAEIEGKSVQLFKERIQTFNNYFNGYSFVEIRKIGVPLSSMIYRIDDVMFIGPHFYKKQSKSTLTIELAKQKWLFIEFQKEFDRMWNDAKHL